MKNFSEKLHLQADARAEYARYFGADKYMQRRRLGKGIVASNLRSRPPAASL